jgi:hypothetical protein
VHLSGLQMLCPSHLRSSFAGCKHLDGCATVSDDCTGPA